MIINENLLYDKNEEGLCKYKIKFDKLKKMKKSLYNAIIENQLKIKEENKDVLKHYTVKFLPLLFYNNKLFCTLGESCFCTTQVDNLEDTPHFSICIDNLMWYGSINKYCSKITPYYYTEYTSTTLYIILVHILKEKAEYEDEKYFSKEDIKNTFYKYLNYKNQYLYDKIIFPLLDKLDKKDLSND